MARDPVCGMEVDPASAPAKTEHQGQTYYFCSPGCKREFDANPEKFVRGQQGQGGHHEEHHGEHSGHH